MKIAFVGKGGSGKTALSSILIRTLGARRLPVLAIDADINQHLGASLGFSPEEAAVPPLGIEMSRLKEYVRGDNTRFSAASMMKTTPPGRGSRFLRIDERNPVYDYFSRLKDGIRFMAVGPFTEEDLGVHCYHSKTGAVELLLNHLIDGPREYAVIDMTAGADSFASGLFTRFDATFVVVEPTEKSVSVYEQYKNYARDYEVHIFAVGNKVESEEDRAFLRERLGADLVACFTSSAFVRRTDRGAQQDLRTLEPENQAAVDALLRLVDAVPKNWPKFYRQAVEFHVKNAKDWANAAAGADLTGQIDPDFDIGTFMQAR